jgi:hypothetical protein
MIILFLGQALNRKISKAVEYAMGFNFMPYADPVEETETLNVLVRIGQSFFGR